LQAAIQALKRLKEPCEVELFTDSEYLREGITNGFTVGKRAPVKKIKNQDLWQELDTVCAKHKVTWHWVRGHSGHFRPRALRPSRDETSRAGQNTITPEQLATALVEFEKKRSSARSQ